MLRFAASASAGINSWDPKNGEIEVGVKGSAAFSLAEGRVALESYFPSQGSRTVQMAYRNALGKTVYHPFGSFRLLGRSSFPPLPGPTPRAVRESKSTTSLPNSRPAQPRC